MLRIALVNCGCVGQSYADVLPFVPQADIVAVVDTDSLAAQQTADCCGTDWTADHVDQLLNAGARDCDAVIIHGPIQEEHLHQMANANKHVLVDLESLAATDLDSLARAFDASSGNLHIGQPLRFQPSNQIIKDRLDAQKLGSPGLLRLHRWENSGFGLVTIESLIREIDLAHWVFGSKPNTLYAIRHGGDQQYIQLHLGFPQGGMAVIDGATSLPEGAQPYHSTTVIGSTGAAYADEHRNTQLLIGAEQTSALLTGEGTQALRNQLACFVDACQPSGAPAMTVNDAQQAQLVMQAAATSLESGQSVRVTGDTYEIV